MSSERSEGVKRSEEGSEDVMGGVVRGASARLGKTAESSPNRGHTEAHRAAQSDAQKP